ncbi:penicillin acylase family protein [Halovivax gelatinilyticus]|uniref:penicillin acylase family protein n=1 Tax=Halovivax gelatinilyticus TaxID=2961597 RepID=UPI0020CA40B4|nr:penicillin acylase family protein [Halovivax gelatinilyticus]
MNDGTTRRAILATVLGAGAVGLAASDARRLLNQFAPLSGSVWTAADREPEEAVESPYGEATVHRDEWAIPHVEADDEAAAYFAVGYVHGIDRLFQLDIQRRQMRGQLAEIVGPEMVDDDAFHVRMDFAGAAEVTWNALSETDHAALVEAYADGVNAAIEDEPLPVEFDLLGYEPAEWTPVDTMLMQKQISWGLTGNFGELRRERVADALGSEVTDELFPPDLDHDVPILRPGDDRLGTVGGADIDDEGTPTTSRVQPRSVRDRPANGRGQPTSARDDAIAGGDDAGEAATTDFLAWLSRFESPAGVGSNSWVVAGEHTESGRPLVANDPHLLLMTPPVWYEQHVKTPERDVRGVTFPGVPFVVIGYNDRGAWGFTNVGADVLDCYRYEIDDERQQYYYDDEWRDFDLEEREIAVADADDETIRVRKTVHGPLIEREGEHVGVAWTGLSATRTSRAIDDLGRSEGVDDALTAIERFDEPTQNFVYADADGRTAYYVTGQIPVRTEDGEPVRGDRVFDGSAGEAEWEGYEPYGESSWDGFVPFDEKPHAIDPAVLATANQRVADEPDHYLGTAYAAPYRGERIYDRLDALTGDGETGVDDHAALQTDRVDPRALQLIPELSAAVSREATDHDRLVDAASTLATWDGEMAPDSEAALLFARWFEHFRAGVCEPHFDDAGLDESYYPNDWVIATLPATSGFFDEATRSETMISALESTLIERENEEWETFGDYQTTAPIEHPFGTEASFLNYDERPIGGSRATVNNYRRESAIGASVRLVAEPGGDVRTILPGGNSGEYFSDHYDDQFETWVDGGYREAPLEIEGERVVTFEEGSR